jgi:hypothetical protein
MKDYYAAINAAAEQNDIAALEELSREAFEQQPGNEHILAFVAGVIYEKNIRSRISLVPEFVERFPNSLHMVRVYLADLLGRDNKFDMATTEARIYLRLARDAGQFEKPLNKIIAGAFQWAFLLLTSAYTMLGARSYALRVLQYANRFANAQWQSTYTAETETLNNELKDVNNLAIDKKWEAFFVDGSHVDFLYKHCADAGYPDMAKRVELLDGNFRFNPAFRIDEEEMFLLIFNKEEMFSLG